MNTIVLCLSMFSEVIKGPNKNGLGGWIWPTGRNDPFQGYSDVTENDPNRG